MKVTAFDVNDSYLLMCKDKAVYDIKAEAILNKHLVPGAILRGTMSYDEWMKSRYSADSNVVARRLMMRALGTDNHNLAIKPTRALSLSDCYWIKEKNSSVLFEEVTPYLHTEWNGNGKFMGGSVSTLFVNGAASKKWDNAKYLRKFSSTKEKEVYDFCKALGLNACVRTQLDGNDLLVENFTSQNCFLESFMQSGKVGKFDHHLVKGVECFGTKFVELMVADYLVEHDDRHSGNFGYLRDASTGEYLGMSPYYDFDWAWCDGVYNIPDNILVEYKTRIEGLCLKALEVANLFEHGSIIQRRAKELLSFL